MKLISSRDNPRVKALHKLRESSGKRGAQVMLDGVHLCQAWLERHGAPAQAIFDSDRLEHPEIQALIQRLPEQCRLALDTRIMKGLISVESGQGVIFVVDPPVPTFPNSLDENCVLLDGIQDPGNVGTLLRTCAAAGIKRVVLGQGSAAAWSAKVIRSGQGAHFALAIHEHVDLLALLPKLRVLVIATTLENSTELYQTHLPVHCAWVFGNEGQGVSAELLNAAAMRLHIAHEAHAVESLNVAAAAAICLFEQRRQAGVGGSA